MGTLKEALMQRPPYEHDRAAVPPDMRHALERDVYEWQVCALGADGAGQVCAGCVGARQGRDAARHAACAGAGRVRFAGGVTVHFADCAAV